MAGKTDIFKGEWCDLVFEGRNKEYGAYQLRRIYERTIAFAILIAGLAFALGVSAPLIISLINFGGDEDLAMNIPKEVVLEAPPPLDEKKPEPPAEPPPPLKTTIKFTPPVIVKDEEAKEEPPPVIEELKEAEAGAKTQEGDSAGVDYSLMEGDGNKIVDEPAEEIFTIVEQMPSFPGGEGELFKYLGKHLQYPPVAKDNGVSGVVYVQFVVDREGRINDVTVLRGIGSGCDQEAVRVVKAMPAWKAGKQNGKAVPVRYNLPIRFSLR